jgi:putative DNA primase/helicase
MMTGAVHANMPELVREVRSQLLRYNMKVSREDVYTELDILARRDPFHPMEEWLLGLKWSGVDAIADALTRVPVSDSKLWAVYFRKWLIQTVAGVCGWRKEGGQQLPHCLVFTGKHGAGKSTWLKNLLPAEFFTAEQSIHLDSGAAKDHQLVALAKPVAELSEIDSTFRKSEVSALKAFISRPIDAIRAPYAREAIPRPRMTSFCGSVNQKDFLVDQTGNRRFWPVEVTDNISRVPVQVEQLWAQAYQLYLAGEDFHLSEGEEQALHAEASARHQQENSYTDLIDSKFGKYMDRDRWGWATITQLRTILNLPPTARGPGDAREFKNACLDYFPDFKVRIAGHRNVFRVPYVPEFSGYIREAKSELSPIED